MVTVIRAVDTARLCGCGALRAASFCGRLIICEDDECEDKVLVISLEMERNISRCYACTFVRVRVGEGRLI